MLGFCSKAMFFNAGFKGLQKDELTSNRLIRDLAKRGHSKSNHALAMDAISRKSYSQAVQLLLVAADGGHGASQLILGNWYGQGNRVPLDLQKSFEYLNKAYANGIFEAAVSLSGLYAKGTPTLKPDPKRAFELLKEAAEHGVAIAQCNLANHYFEGSDYVKQNPSFAVEYHKMAAEQKFTMSQFFLAKLCQTGFKAQLENGTEEIPIDLKTSKYFYERVIADYDGSNYYDLVLKAKLALSKFPNVLTVPAKNSIM